jgi:F0F1-type ATP synthase delta subunit
MPVHGIAGRYAAALYMAGARAKKLDVIDKDLSKVSPEEMPLNLVCLRIFP